MSSTANSSASPTPIDYSYHTFVSQQPNAQVRQCTYSDVGPREGAILLFLPGMGGHHSISFLFRRLAEEQNIRIINVDRPGKQGTTVVELEHRVDGYVEIVMELLEHLGISEIHILAQSMGCLFVAPIIRAAAATQRATQSLSLDQLKQAHTEEEPQTTPQPASATINRRPIHIASPIFLVSSFVSLSVAGTSSSLRLARSLPAWMLRGAASTIGFCMGSAGGYAARSSFKKEDFEYEPALKELLQHYMTTQSREDSGGLLDDMRLALEDQQHGLWNQPTLGDLPLVQAEQTASVSPAFSSPSPSPDSTSSSPSSSPPSLRLKVYHGSKDAMVPVGAIERVFGRKSVRAIDTELVIVPDATHNEMGGFPFWRIIFEQINTKQQQSQLLSN